MSNKEWQEPLGCLLWILVFFVGILLLNIGGDLIDFLSDWLKAHS